MMIICICTISRTFVLRTSFGRAGTFVPASYQQDYGLNLSISLSPGKESNSNSRSRGDRTGNSPTLNRLVRIVVPGVLIYEVV